MTQITVDLPDEVAMATIKFFSGDRRSISYAVDHYLRNYLRRWGLIPRLRRGRKKLTV